jgi:5'-nucleotidase
VSFDFNTAKPAPEQENDESVVYRNAIAVSPMQAGFAYPSDSNLLTEEDLRTLLPANPDN